MNMSKFGKSIAHIFSNEKKNSAQQATAAAAEIEAAQEAARKETLKMSKTSRIGFPHKPTCMAYDLVQHVLAIGTRYGYVKLYGGESVEYTLFHSSTNSSQNSASAASLQTQSAGSSASAGSSTASAAAAAGASPNPGSSTAPAYPSAVTFMSFLMNEGALITYCDDATLSLWLLRQKQPCVSYCKKLVNERATTMLMPFQSNWIYLGTEKGNIYILNVYNNFSQSGYDIKWNNVIELSQRNKPGRVIHLSDQPLDSGKLLIGYDSGLIVLWNIKAKRGEMRFYGTAETMSSISWFYDGKQFMSSHNNGSLIVWNTKDTKPVEILHPHMSDTDLIPQYNMIKKVSWEANGRGEQLVIFADGLPTADSTMKDAITIIKNNKLKTIIEMKAKIIEFYVVGSSPYVSDTPSDPSALIVLLENDLVTIDLKSEGFPIFHHHHAINLHDSPVTACEYVVDPNWQLFQALQNAKEKLTLQQLQQQQQQIQQQQQQQQQTAAAGATISSVQLYSNQPYPITGGVKSSKPNVFPYNELIVTGHEDGSVKLWDTSGISLTLLHKLKTHKLFDKRRNNDILPNGEPEFPYKIIALEVNGCYLAVAAAGGHVTLYKYYTKSSTPGDDELAETPLLEVPINYESESKSQQESSSDPIPKKDLKSYLRTKIGLRRQSGYQPELVCLLTFYQRIPVVTSININPKNSTLVFGTDEGMVVIDYANRIILMNSAVTDLYSSQEISQRMQKSPKKGNKSITNVSSDLDELNLNESHNTASLSKQFTIDSSFHQATMRDTLSQNSSNSSTENLVSTEGVSCLAINDNATPAQPNKANSDYQQYNSQLWVGTNFGTVVVYNSTSLINLNNLAASNDSSNLSNSNNLKPTTVMPTGNVHVLKGAILTIAFLDGNGNMYNGVSNTANSGGPGSSRNKLVSNASLAIDFAYTPSPSMLSNSIADNFYGSSSPGASNLNSSVGSSTNDSSPTSSGFVNPFANAVLPDTKFEEMKATQPPVSKSKKPLSISRSTKVEMSSVVEQPDRPQFVVLCSECEIKVLALPTQTCLYKYPITDGTLAKACVASINSLAYLLCYNTNGNFLVFNLVNIKPCLNASLVKLATIKEKETIDRINKTFSIGSKGHSIFMCSASEIQKCYLATSNTTTNLTEMLPELFDPKIMLPPAPKPSIFKSIFSNTPVDREELFGDQSGKPSTSIIKNVDGDVAKVKGEMSELLKLGIQRGEKLSALELKSEQMTQAASAYAKTAHELANKYKKSSKWTF